MRAISILLIVGSHTAFWTLKGGAHLLIAVAGFNFAQFRLGARGGPWRSIARIALPSVAWIGLAAAVGSQLEWRHVFLVNHIFGAHDTRWPYWFIESLVLILGTVGALLAIPAVRRHERRHPFGTALAVAAVGLAIRFNLFLASTDHRTSRPHEVLWLFALGWAGAVAVTARQRMLVSALVLPAVWGFWAGQPLRGVFVAGGILLLLWAPNLPIPRPVHRMLGAVAAMSLVLYLTHWQVFPPLLRSFGPGAAFAGSVATAFVVSGLYNRIAAALGSFCRIRKA